MYFDHLNLFLFGGRKLFFKKLVLTFKILVFLHGDIKLVLEFFKTDFHLMLNSDVFSDFLLSLLNGFLKYLIIFGLNSIGSFSDSGDYRLFSVSFSSVVDLLGHVINGKLINVEQLFTDD